MGMSERTWAAHANPWSVWTRIPILPLLALSVFARTWIGWWFLLPVALLVGWAFVNPRIFPPPHSLEGWASRGVLGERIWLERNRRALPRHHRVAAGLLVAASIAGMPVLAFGLWRLDGWATVTGVVVVAGAKLWYFDRMAWLHDEMARESPSLRA
jgi:hypothetical protein